MKNKKKEDYQETLAMLKAKFEDKEKQALINKQPSLSNTFKDVLESCGFVGIKLMIHRTETVFGGVTAVIREYQAVKDGVAIKGSVVNVPCEPEYIDTYLKDHPNNDVFVKNGHTVTIVNN